MDSQIRLIGIFWVVLSIFGLLIGLSIAAFLVLGGTLADDETALPVMGAIAIIVMLVFLITYIPGLIGGIGILKHRHWGRILTLVMSFFALLSFPFGTALSIFTMVVLFDSRSLSYFREEDYQRFIERSY